MFYKLLVVVALVMAVAVICLPSLSIITRALVATLITLMAAEVGALKHERTERTGRSLE